MKLPCALSLSALLVLRENVAADDSGLRKRQPVSEMITTGPLNLFQQSTVKEDSHGNLVEVAILNPGQLRGHDDDKKPPPPSPPTSSLNLFKQTRIINGEESSNEDYPFQVQLEGYLHIGTDEWAGYCGGSTKHR